jgi:hypothetical protein
VYASINFINSLIRFGSVAALRMFFCSIDLKINSYLIKLHSTYLSTIEYVFRAAVISLSKFCSKFVSSVYTAYYNMLFCSYANLCLISVFC